MRACVHAYVREREAVVCATRVGGGGYASAPLDHRAKSVRPLFNLTQTQPRVGYILA